MSTWATTARGTGRAWSRTGRTARTTALSPTPAFPSCTWAWRITPTTTLRLIPSSASPCPPAPELRPAAWPLRPPCPRRARAAGALDRRRRGGRDRAQLVGHRPLHGHARARHHGRDGRARHQGDVLPGALPPRSREGL